MLAHSGVTQQTEVCRTTEETVESITCLELDQNNLQHVPLWRFISWVIFAWWWMVKLLTSAASPGANQNSSSSCSRSNQIINFIVNKRWNCYGLILSRSQQQTICTKRFTWRVMRWNRRSNQ